MKPSNASRVHASMIRGSRVAWAAAFSAACTTLFATVACAGWSTLPVPPDSIQIVTPQLLDRDGNLWVTTLTGNYIHDGSSWKPFTIDGHRATWGRIFADSSGNVWLPGVQWHDGSIWHSGAFRFDGTTWNQLTTATGLPHDNYHSGVVDRQGTVWLAGGDSNASYVSRFGGTAWTDYSNHLGGTLRFADSAGNLWFDGGAWVARFDGNDWYPLVTPPTLLVRDIIEDREGRLWFVSRKAVHRLEGTSFVDVSPTALIRSDGRTTYVGGFADPEGTVWVFQQFPSYLLSYEGNHWRALTHADGAPPFGQSLGSGFCDHSGTFWFREGGTTVWRYDGELLRNHAVRAIQDHFHPAALCAANGDIWVPNSALGGVDRYDGIEWKHYSAADGLPSDYVMSMGEDQDRALWFGTGDNGVGRFDGSTWTTYRAVEGLGNSYADQVLSDARGGVWVLGRPQTFDENATLVDTLSHFDGASWTVLTAPGLLPFQSHTRAMTDRQGNLWVSAVALDSIFTTEGFWAYQVRPDGLYRHDGVTWTHYADNVTSSSGFSQHLWEDSAGRLWAGTEGLPLSRFDGTGWTQVPNVASPFRDTGFAEDRRGNLWLANGNSDRFDGAQWSRARVPAGSSTNGVLADRAGRVWYFSEYGGGGWTLTTNFDGENFRTFGANQGFPSDGARAALADSAGGLWFDIGGELTRYVPDRAAPVVALISKPPRRSPTGNLSAAFRAAFEPTSFVEYSYRLDGGPWSSWSVFGSWTGDRLPDGEHVLEVQARDYVGNISAHPTVARFEVDATPPVPVLSSPAFGTAVRGSASLTGTATDSRFSSYQLDYRVTGAASWAGATSIIVSSTPVLNGPLGTWDTPLVADGSYDLRLSVTDSLGLVGSVVVSVVVDNHAPYLDETTPAKVTAADGGDVYTTNAETHLYFPPHAFAQDAVVMVVVAPSGSAPATLPSGGVKVLDGYELGWAGALQKAARFTMSYAGAALPAGTLALYRSGDGMNWERLGGTLDPGSQRVSLAVTGPGRYALYADDGMGTGTASLSSIAFTPRVFSPSGGFADTQVGISFTLGKPAPVTVKVYSRSGRLIREVTTGQELSAGANMVPWDGRDRNGGFVVDGVYLVTVEALGQTETKTLAVVK